MLRLPQICCQSQHNTTKHNNNKKQTSPNHHCSTQTFSSVSLVVDTTSSSSPFLQLLAIGSFAASKNQSFIVEFHATLHPAVLFCHLVGQLLGPLLGSGPEGADGLSSHNVSRTYGECFTPPSFPSFTSPPPKKKSDLSLEP